LEDFARILDYLPQGHPEGGKFHRDPLAFALGETEFKLFELVPKPNAALNAGDRVYVGKEVPQRTQVDHVKRRVGWEELTNAAQNELSFIIAAIVKEQEAKFIRFYNEAQAITTRFHMLELLPGLGKKAMWAVVEERKKGPFQDFADLARRVPLLHHPDKLIVKRIEMEISDVNQKYHIFAAR
jgi:putative nucleotide binding protein